MLIIFGGLPGVGKTTIARELARHLGAMHVRVDSIEQAIRDSGTLSQPLNDAGYRVAYAIAEDNLRLGRTVIADSVNPIHLSRDAWIGVAHRARVGAAEIELICSDPQQHRQPPERRPQGDTSLERARGCLGQVLGISRNPSTGPRKGLTPVQAGIILPKAVETRLR